MTSKDKGPVSPQLVLTACLTATLTIVTSIVYVVLCIIGLVWRGGCDTLRPDSISASSYFTQVLRRAYFLDPDCTHSLSQNGITQPSTVFILILLTLIVSICTLTAAITLIVAVTRDDMTSYVVGVGYTHIGMCVLALCLEVTAASHFGPDAGTIGDQMNISSPGIGANYTRNIIRLNALLLMVTALKGFVVPLVNGTLIGILIYYLVDLRQVLEKNQHSVHKMGPINAFDQSRRQENHWQQPRRAEENWPRRDDTWQHNDYSERSRGPQMNSAYIHDEDLPSPRSLNQQHSMSDYSNNRYYDRPESWQRPSPVPTVSRPFSYLEDPKKAAPAATCTPHLPAPDYSPPSGRRLKSSLKPAYQF